MLVHECAVRDGVDGDARRARQLVFRDQADRKEQRVTGDVTSGFWDGTAFFVHLRDGHALHALFAVDLADSGGKVKRNIKILKALDDIARQAAGIRQQLAHGLDLRAL